MNWLGFDLLMFAASVILYLLARRAAILKQPVYFTNLAMFVVPLVVFCGMDMIWRPSFALNSLQVFLIVFAGVVFSYVSNWASLKSIESAPNPGYSLVISKSYVVLTTIIAVPLFGAELSNRAVLAIILIVGAAAFIMVDPARRQRSGSKRWLVLSLGAFFGWGLLSLVAKFLFTQGVAPLAFLSLLFLIATLCIVVENTSKRVDYSHVFGSWGLFIAIGLAAAAFNFFSFVAIKMAPNVGYVNATNASSIAIVTVFSALLFGDELSLRKLGGVAGVVAGLILLLS